MVINHTKNKYNPHGVDSSQVNKITDNSKKNTDLLTSFPDGTTVMRNTIKYADTKENFPTQWGTLVTFKAGLYGYQFYLQSNATNAEMLMRSYDDNTNTWKDWKANETATGAQAKADAVKTWIQGFGYGGDSIKLNDGIDLNTAQTPGRYFLAGSYTNGPIDVANWGHLEVYRYGGGSANRIIQLFTKDNASQIYLRVFTGSQNTWSAWKDITGADYGLGYQNKSLGQDLNTLNETGFYYATTGSTNVPSGATNGYVLHQKLSDTYKSQIYIEHTTSRMFKRIQHNGTWVLGLKWKRQQERKAK
ncbi:pyocin knob domain-containing protein [Heyndrickxia sp. NPDC080065]|uniref:pyocin knob domain-containing protein n=1 Tax=Heyndrickxia sp. NPDC080065 TaxID=3390568 RepID=UPI003D07AFA2